MAPQTTSRMTYKDFLEMPDDGKQYELIEGELILNPAPIPRHQLVAGNLYHAIRNYFDQHDIGKVMHSPIDVVLADDVLLQPDLIIIRNEHLSIIGPKNIQGPPDVVIEVLSDGTRRKDEIVKRKLYERYGVAEYWVVDPANGTVTIYRRSGTSFARIEAGGTVATPLLPGFALDINVIFDV